MHPLAGKPAPKEMLANVPRLVCAYYVERPDPREPGQRVSFGTSGHRGSSLATSFNEAHVLAICQAICEYRAAHSIDGPLHLGMDTHALSEPAHESALEVLAGNGVDVLVARGLAPTPTPLVSHAILGYNRGLEVGLSDGIVITPSHNPPEDGGLKYNPPSGGPADTNATNAIEARANEILEGLRLSRGVRRFRRVGVIYAVRPVPIVRTAAVAVHVFHSSPRSDFSCRYPEARDRRARAQARWHDSR